MKMKKTAIAAVLILAVAAIWMTQKPNTKGVEYPAKPITVVIPWGAGGPTDIAARMYLPGLEKHLGQPITIVNTPGASGATGTEMALEQPADGYTIIFSAETPATFQVMGLSSKSYDDLSVLMMMVNDPKVLVVDKNSKYNTMEELAADIKANPGKVTMSYTGPGASGHIQGLLYEMVGLDVTMTPFESGSPALTAVMGGLVDFTNTNFGTAESFLKNGDLKALAVFSDKPNPVLPDVPALADAVPELSPYLPMEFPNCIAVAADTPEDVKAKITEAALAAAKEPAWVEFAKEKNYDIMHNLIGQEADAYWRKWSSLVSWLLWDNGVAKYSPQQFDIPQVSEFH